MSVTDWSPQPGGNALADTGIKAARDGAAARDFSPSFRGLMAKAAALALDQGGALVSTGTDNAYEVATNSAFTEIKPGVSLSFWADRDNTGAPTLNVDGSGPRRLFSADGLTLPAGAIQGGLLYTVVWNAPFPGAPPGWRMVGAAAGAASTGLAGFDFSGVFNERAQYDAEPKGKVFLAIADTPAGPSWTLYVKRSNGFGDWSAGLPIKASPAQTTAEAQAAVEQAARQAEASEAARLGAVVARQGSEAAQFGSATQAAIAAGQAMTAEQHADAAAAAVIEARTAAGLVGALLYDMGDLGQPSDGSDSFNFGSL